MAIRYGCFLYSYGLSGSSVLLLDCVEACDAILSSRDSTAPRNEALYMMGSLLYLPHLPLSVPSSSSRLTTADKELDADKLRERIVKIVYRAAVRERGRIARCIALYQVGILVFSELWTNSCTENVQKGLDILLSSLKVRRNQLNLMGLAFSERKQQTIVESVEHYYYYRSSEARTPP